VAAGFEHGPTHSGLPWMMRRHPERSAEIIEDRRQTLQANMRHTLAAMKAAAEERLASGASSLYLRRCRARLRVQ